MLKYYFSSFNRKFSKLYELKLFNKWLASFHSKDISNLNINYLKEKEKKNKKKLLLVDL